MPNHLISPYQQQKFSPKKTFLNLCFVDATVRSYTANRHSPVIKGNYDGNMTVGMVLHPSGF